MKLRSHKGHRRTTAAAIALMLIILGSIVYYRQSATTASNQGSIKDFTRLDEIFETEGMAKFISSKQALREQLRSRLRATDENDEAMMQANQIAVYLFPEILPETDFEKTAALELWAPYQNAIEAAPKTLDSRQKFEEMRANIWNYENPSKKVPVLSPVAMQVIKIYDVMSAH